MRKETMHPPFLPAAAFATLALAFGTSHAEEAKSTFDWPAPAKIGISETAIKNGNHAEMTYALDVKKRDDGKLIIRMVDFQFDSFNHQPITPEFERALRPVIDSFGTLPSFVVNEEGHLVDIVGIDALIDGTGKYLDSVREDGKGKEVADQMKDPAVKKMLMRALSEYWNGWVEAWIGFGPKPGETVEEPFREGLVPNQPEIEGVRTYRHLGTDPDNPSLIHLKIDSHIGDPTAGKAIGGLLSRFDQKNKGKSDIDLENMPSITVDGEFEVKIDPTTYRPAWAKRSKNIQVSGPTEEESGSRVESHEYTFHWE